MVLREVKSQTDGEPPIEVSGDFADLSLPANTTV